MPNLFLNIPVPAANGAGAAVDVSAMAATKTIIVGGPFQGSVTLEYATDDTATRFAPVPSGTFNNNPGRVTVDLAVRWLRAVMSSYKSGAANVDVGGVVDGDTSFAQLSAVPADVSSMPAFKTVVSSGAGIVEISQDGVSWSQVFSFNNAGGQSGSFVAAFARCSGSTMWMGGADLGEDDDQIPQPPFPVPPIVTTIYVRTAGSDTMGTGTLANPYATLPRAARDVPNPIPPGYFYVIDNTGTTETLPDNYRLPAWKGASTFNPSFESRFWHIGGSPVTIEALPANVPLVPATNSTIRPFLALPPFVPGSPRVIGVANDPISNLVTITIDQALPATWTNANLKGKHLIGSATGFEQFEILEVTPTTLLIACDFPPTFPADIMQESAHLSGGGDLTLGQFNCDVVIYHGQEITNTGGGNGLFVDGLGLVTMELCTLQTPFVSPEGAFQTKFVDTRIYGSDTLIGASCWGAAFSFFDGVINAAFGDSLPTSITFVNCGFEACDPIESRMFIPVVGIEVGKPTMFFSMENCLVKNGTGAGVILHGNEGRLKNVDIQGCQGDGLVVDKGVGYLTLENVGSTLPNGAGGAGVGLRVNDGQSVTPDAATYSSPTPLSGFGGIGVNDMKVGGLAVRSWANYQLAVPRPALSEIDSTANLVTGFVTGTGSRVSS